MDEIITINPLTRWEVITSDPPCWRVGIYRPEHGSAEEVRELEKHSCPELFICAGGRAGLLIRDGGGERAVMLDPGQAILVNDYHAGFADDPAAYFIVVERTSFETEYLDRKTGTILRTVRT